MSLQCRSELLLSRLSAALIVEFVGNGELAGDKALRYWWWSPVGVCHRRWSGELSITQDHLQRCGFFATCSSRGMGLIFSGDSPVSLLLLRAGGLNGTHGASWFYRVASGTGNARSIFLFLLYGMNGRFTFIDLNSLCCCGMMVDAALPRLGIAM
jgi:hypothetical protein